MGGVDMGGVDMGGVDMHTFNSLVANLRYRGFSGADMEVSPVDRFVAIMG
jgi:hypothetical protein